MRLIAHLALTDVKAPDAGQLTLSEALAGLERDYPRIHPYNRRAIAEAMVEKDRKSITVPVTAGAGEATTEMKDDGSESENASRIQSKESPTQFVSSYQPVPPWLLELKQAPLKKAMAEVRYEYPFMNPMVQESIANGIVEQKGYHRTARVAPPVIDIESFREALTNTKSVIARFSGLLPGGPLDSRIENSYRELESVITALAKDSRYLRPAERAAFTEFVRKIETRLETSWRPAWFGGQSAERFAGRLKDAHGLAQDITDFIAARADLFAARMEGTAVDDMQLINNFNQAWSILTGNYLTKGLYRPRITTTKRPRITFH